MFAGLSPPYRCLVVDPPWYFSSNSVKKPGRNARRHYPTMKVAEIAAMPVGELAADDCWLFLWIPGPHFVLGAHLPILKAWGFEVSGIGFTWIKTNGIAGGLFFGGGFTTRKNAEFCVIARRGRPPIMARDVPEVIMAPRREHSRKPEEFKRRVLRLVGRKKTLELFAREPFAHWHRWGNEKDKFT